MTIKEFKNTAYHHYGKTPFSLIKFIYYSGFRINTFIVYENDLTKKLSEHNLDANFKIVKPTIKELELIREGIILPREFYYDKIYNAKTCYLAFRGDKVAYIHWVLSKGDYSRFLNISTGVAELNYNTTLPEFRGYSLAAKVMAYISLDLQSSGCRKLMGVVHEFNYPQNKCMLKAGFREVARIKAIGPFNKKMQV